MSDVLLFDLSQQLEKLFAARRYAAGFALGRHILQTYPRHLPTYKQMGLAALAAGLTSDSADLLQRALSADPEDGEMWAALHDAASQLKMHPDAEVAGVYAQDILQPEAGATDIASGHIVVREKDWDRAYAAFRSGYQQHPERMDAAMGLMTALYQLEHWRAAMDVAQHILIELPYSLKAHWFVIRCSVELNDNKSALKRHLRIARSLDPDDLYVTRWFDDVRESEMPKPQSTIPAWDDTERWEFRGDTPPRE